MKVAVLLALTVLTTKRVTCAAIQAPVDIISLDDITEADRKTIEFLNSYYNPVRPKRSHDDALSSLKASIGQSIKSKLSSLAKGSASASAKFSSSSSGHKTYHHHHDHHPEYDHKSFDFWTLKKSILNTLLQAVKAIKGGVIAIKGQLIKGSGYLISAKGKLISAKGEAITKLGKNIATEAVLSSPHGHEHDHSEEYHHEHFHHSGAEEYGSPSAPGPEYELPDHHHYHHHPPHHHEDKPDAGHAGVLILKKIPKHEHEHEHSEHLPIEHKVPDFKPIEHKGPSFGEIIGKFFSASTSLKPGVPAPFGDDKHHDHHDHHDHSDHHDHHDHHSHYHHHDHDDDHDHDHDHDHHYSDHSSHSSHEEYHSPESSHHESHHEYSHASSNNKPKTTSLFEEAPPYVNIAEYASETKGSSQTVVQTTTTEKPKPLPIKVQTTAQSYDEVRPLSSFSNLGFDTTSLLSDSGNKPNYFLGTLSNQPNTAFPPYQDSFSSITPTAFSSDTTSMQFGAFPGAHLNTNVKFATSTDLGPQIFPRQNYFDEAKPQYAYPQRFTYNTFSDNIQTPSNPPLNRPTRSKSSNRKRPVYPSPQFMKTLMYDRGPNGPKRL